MHGGEEFNESVLITDQVIEKIKEAIDIAPLHNPQNLSGIRAIEELVPDIPQVAVFYTAFHQTMPDYAYMYGIPYTLYQKYGIRRYGFHGTSHRYVSKRACEFLGLDINKTKMITAHIGNGASITAIKNGKSVDTTMGFTPIEGLMMGTRSGDIDLGVVTYLIEKERINSQSVSTLFNKHSGLIGVSGVSSDMRDVTDAFLAGNDRARLALEIYQYRMRKYLGSYFAALNGADVLVFTGGVGENHFRTRKNVCDGLSFLGIKIDDKINNESLGVEALISTPDSSVKVVIIPTDEEYMIASDTMSIVTK